MSNNLLIVPSEKPSSLLMVPVTAVKEDLITKTDELIYVPIATKNTYGVVKIGEGLHILNGVLTIDPSGESLNTKVDKFQGIENEGKVLLVDEDGYVSLGYAEGSVDVFSNGVSAVDDAGVLDFSSNFIISEENGKAKISLTGIPEKLSDLDLDLDIAYRLDIANHNTDPNSHLDIRGKLLEVEAVAKGRSQAISYDNYMYMINAFNALPINEYSVGQSVYIGTLNVPDLWISKVEDTSETYVYTSDEAIINLLNTNGNIRVGYYVLSPLETEKVDLTDYVTLDTIQTVSGIKTFTEQIGLLNAAEGEADFIKHINNNFLITSHDGKSLLNIDEQLEKIYSFNKELATKEYVDEIAEESGVSDYPDLTNLPVINTNNSTTLSVNSNETIEGTLNLHKVSKTGLLSDLIEDNNHRVVTDTEKATWNSKLGANALLGIEGDVDTLKTKTLLLEDSYNELYADISDLETNKVDKTTTVNGKALSGNIELNAGDVNALPNTTKYGASLSLSIDNTTYVVTAQLKDQNGNNLGTAQTIDLPLESVVVSGSYDKTTKEVILTLKDGSTIKFSVADLVSGLVSQVDLDSLEVIVEGLETRVINIENKNTEQDTEISNLKTSKQATLVSGTNIKTINGETILGSGNIEIAGGGSALYDTTGQNTDGAMTQKSVTDELNKKISKSTTATANNIAMFDANGELQDSGIIADTDAAGIRSAYGNLIKAEDTDDAVGVTKVGNVSHKIWLHGVDERPQYNNGSSVRYLAKVEDLNNLSMLQGSTVTASATDWIADAGNWFTAPENGIAYIRIKGNSNGYLGFHLLNESGQQDLAYNTQYLDTAYGAMYNAVFLMKKGQRIYCYENYAGYSWGGLYFIASQRI